MSYKEDHLRPADQVTLLTNQIQWLASRLDKLNADMRVASKADEKGEVDFEYLDFDEMHEDGREELQAAADKLREVYERLANHLNRRDAVSKADMDITDGTLEHLPNS